MEAQSSIATQLQRVVNECTLEATEYERAQRLGLLQPALDALAQSAYQQQQQQQQQAGLVSSATPAHGRANVLHRPLAAATHATEQDATGTPADAAAGVGASKAGTQPTPATAGMLPTPLLMTPAGAALLQTPATGWGVSAADTGVRPVAGFPHHFLHGMMGGTPYQQARPMQQHVETDDGKLSKKRQGYHIEPAALQKLIEKQQLEAQRKQQQELQAVAAASARVSQAAAEAEAAAAAAAVAAAAAAAVSAPLPASGSTNPPDEPPPRQPEQQHRPRVMSRLPPQVQEQAERQAAERARKAAEQKAQEEADAAAGSRVAHSVRAVGGGGVFAQGGRQRQQGAPMTAADCLESPNNGSLGGLRLPVGPELDPQGPEGMGMGLDNSKLFGSAQKRLRLSLCDEHGSLMPGGQPLISPVVLPTPSPAVHAATPAPVPGLAGRGGAGGAGGGPAGGGGSSSAAAGAAAGGGGGGQQAAGAAVGTSQEAPTPSKFFTGSPVPQTERRALGHAEPETPMALLMGQAPARTATDVQEALMNDPLRGGAQAKAEGAAAGGHAEGGTACGSGWVPVPGQAPAVLGATPAPPAPPAAGGEGDDMELDPAAAAAMPLPESPVKQVTAVGAVQAGVSGGGESGGMVLQTPQGQEQAVAATPVTGL